MGGPAPPGLKGVAGPDLYEELILVDSSYVFHIPNYTAKLRGA